MNAFPRLSDCLVALYARYLEPMVSIAVLALALTVQAHSQIVNPPQRTKTTVGTHQAAPAPGAAAQQVAPGAPHSAETPASPPAAPDPAASGTQSPSPSATEPASTSTPNRLPKVEGDYVPCKFTPSEIATLVSPELATKLTAADEEDLKERVVEAASTQTGDPLLRGNVLKSFLKALDKDTLSGLTPSQALNHVIVDLSTAEAMTSVPVTTGDVDTLANEMKSAMYKAGDDAVDSFANFLKTDTGFIGTVSRDQLNGAAQAKVNDWSAANGNFAQSVSEINAAIGAAQPSAKDGEPSTTVNPADVDGLAKQMKNYEHQESDTAITSFSNYLKGLSGFVGTVTYGQLQSDAQSKVSSWSTANSSYASAVPAILAAIGAALPLDNSKVVDAARNSLEFLERPTDVGCAMSILTYTEARTAYGYRIANEYIAVQIVVRNLNRDKPFLVHDAEFQVNSDPTGELLGRFYSGRDKVIVRSLSAAQSSFDPRALFVHTLEGFGAIISAAVPVFSTVPTFANSAAVFNGALVPGLDKFWKDETGDQLNLLNDTGFSSSVNSQTIVPQLATAMFVIFIPSKQFQEDWWTHPCVEKTYFGRTDANGRFTAAGGAGGTTGSSQPPLTGVNVQHALQACGLEDKDFLPRKERHWWTLWYRQEDHRVQSIPPAMKTKTTAPNANTTAPNAKTAAPNADIYRNAYSRPYKRWSGNSLQIFAALSSTVVAGTHIMEDSQLQPSLTALNCPTEAKTGDVQFPTPDTGTLSCPMTGKNLDKVAQLRLRNAKDATDVATAEGPVTVSGDSTKGTVAFPTAALHALTQPAYTVFTVTGTGVEQKTSETLHFSTDPFMQSVSPPTVDFSKAPQKAQNLTIAGYGLADVDSVILSDANAHAVTIPLTVDALKRDTQLQVSLDPTNKSTNFAVFGKTASLTITVTVNKKVVGNSQTLPFTGP